MNCVVLIFSKDRALQLDATLRSLLAHCSDISKSQICVLFTTSGKSHENQYSLLENDFRSYSYIKFIREENFHSDVIALLAPYDYALFLVDDNIFIRDFGLFNIILGLQENQDSLGFSLRLGKNTTYCYPLDKGQRLPEFKDIGEGILKYNWVNAEYDFGYPLEVSSSVYRTTDILPHIAGLSFNNPNTLESVMAADKTQFEETNPFLLCYESSVTFCTPLNKVQSVFATNRASDNVLYSAENLSKLFQDGYRIDISAYQNFIPNACHQEVDLKLIDPSPSPLFFGSKPKFSVIMANYNQDKFIGQAIESVLHQTFQDWELIIVDDYSTDKSLAIVEKYLSDKRIRLIRHNSNKGYIAALKTGIDSVSIEFFGILDSDDVLLPDAIETIYAAHITNDDAGMIYSQFMYCDERLNPTQLGYCKQIPQGKTNIEVDTVSHFKTFKLKYYRQTEGFAEHCFCAEDKDITYRIEEVSRLLFIDKVLYHYRVLPKSQSHDGDKRQKGLANMSRAKINAIKRRDEKNREQQKVAIEYFRNATEYLYQLDFVNAESQINNYRGEINYRLFPRHDNRFIPNPNVSVIIVAYNTNQLLLDCIHSLLNQNYKNFEIIVIDNGGNDALLMELLSLPILYLKCPFNFIPSEGRNIGAYFAKSEIIAFLDDDATVSNNYIESIVEAFDTYDIVGFRGKILPKSEHKFDKLPETYDLGEIPIPSTIVAEGNSAFLKDKYLKLTGMNPLLFGGEGLDFSVRVLLNYGENLTLFWPKTLIYHDPADPEKETIKATRYEIMHKYLQAKYPFVWQYHSSMMTYAKDNDSRQRGNSLLRKKFLSQPQIFVPLCGERDISDMPFEHREGDKDFALSPGLSDYLCIFINTYYPAFLDNHYRKNPKLAFEPYEKQKYSLQAEFFGDSDFYSRGLRIAGWNAEDLIINCAPLQQAWAKENNFSGYSNILEIAVEQIRRKNPQTVYLQDLNVGTKAFLSAIRPYSEMIIGQIASPLPPKTEIAGFDIILSSFPHFVERFRKMGVTAYYQPLAFDPRILEKLPQTMREYQVTFIGGVSPAHGKGKEILESLAALIQVRFWGYGAESLPEDSPVRKNHYGEAWGLDMFTLLRKSFITINRHIDVAENYANNMRLFEATGCGALLITDYKDNLNELFEIGEEIVAYRSPEEAAALIKYYLSNPKEAEDIARAGQARTLRDHTYTKRMEQTAEILERHLRYQRESHLYPSPDMSKISYGKTPIRECDITDKLTAAWQSDKIPAKQRALVQQELESMYKGHPPVVYQVLADSLRHYVFPYCSILEIGCSSGYYYEILEYLLNMRISYTGVDYSAPLIAMAKHYYPKASFYVADGANLPFDNDQFYIAISSCILLHTPNYQAHVAETARVAQRYLVAHRTPVRRQRPTQHLKKFAYGIETVELIFNEKELLSEFATNGLNLINSIEYYSSPNEDYFEVTYLFEKKPV